MRSGRDRAGVDDAMPIIGRLDCDALATLGATGVNYGPACLGAHALAETMLMLPLQITGLKGSLQA